MLDLLTGGYMLDNWEKCILYTIFPYIIYNYPIISMGIIAFSYNTINHSLRTSPWENIY